MGRQLQQQQQQLIKAASPPQQALLMAVVLLFRAQCPKGLPSCDSTPHKQAGHSKHQQDLVANFISYAR
jgi:hypothetical protein